MLQVRLAAAAVDCGHSPLITGSKLAVNQGVLGLQVGGRCAIPSTWRSPSASGSRVRPTRGPDCTHEAPHPGFRRGSPPGGRRDGTPLQPHTNRGGRHISPSQRPARPARTKGHFLGTSGPSSSCVNAEPQPGHFQLLVLGSGASGKLQTIRPSLPQAGHVLSLVMHSTVTAGGWGRWLGTPARPGWRVRSGSAGAPCRAGMARPGQRPRRGRLEPVEKVLTARF
jgi:hypothetical protein